MTNPKEIIKRGLVQKRLKSMYFSTKDLMQKEVLDTLDPVERNALLDCFNALSHWRITNAKPRS